MSILEGFLQGLIQGLTEFLPVSSSGHLSLFQHLFGLSGESSLFFTVMLHLGTLVAVFIAYFRTILEMIMAFFQMLGQLITGKFRYSKCTDAQRMVLMILVALIPLMALYFVRDFFSALSEDADIVVEGVCFLFTGCLLFLADRCVKGHKGIADMKPRDALFIGAFQGVAALPGVSRSGSTISAGLLRGFSREFMVRFSFILGIPAIIGANLSEFADAAKQGMDVELLPLVVGVVTAAVVGLLAIKLITWLVKTDRFIIFAYYTLALGTLVLILGLVETFAGQSLYQMLAG